jgi:signal transduction histidine kinase
VDDLLSHDDDTVEETMNASRAFSVCASVTGLLLACGTTQAAGNSAADKGSAEAAKAMLERAVAAVKADKSRALADFNAGAHGFRDHDLYVFCARSDGTVDAHVDAAQIGRNIKDLYDVDGVAFGQEMMAISREGEIKAVKYMWPEPASHVPVDKVTFFTRVADQMCGVGYYK